MQAAIETTVHITPPATLLRVLKSMARACVMPSAFLPGGGGDRGLRGCAPAHDRGVTQVTADTRPMRDARRDIHQADSYDRSAAMFRCTICRLNVELYDVVLLRANGDCYCWCGFDREPDDRLRRRRTRTGRPPS